MKTVSLSGSPRASVGSVDAKELRNNDMVPCVIYGGKDQVYFSAHKLAFKPIIFTPEVSIVSIEVNGKTYRTILQEAQYHKISDDLIHADFLEITDDKPVTVELPVRTTGVSPGVRAGGKLVVKMRKLKVRGLVAKLPDYIDISIEKLDIGKSVVVSDIVLDGVSMLNAKNVTVVSVVMTRQAAQAEQAAAKAPAKAAPAKK
jgi:large subunit ribosomal protein L25